MKQSWRHSVQFSLLLVLISAWFWYVADRERSLLELNDEIQACMESYNDVAVRLRMCRVANEACCR